MNALRNLFSSRTLNYLRQSGQNALYNITQSTSVEPSSTLSISPPTPTGNRVNETLFIPQSLLDATSLIGRRFNSSGLSLSPTALKRFRKLEKKVELVYRCKICNTRNTKIVSEAAYTNGVVILQCDGCSVDHLIIDNLGWFANKGKTFDQILAEQGNRIKVIKVNQNGDVI